MTTQHTNEEISKHMGLDYTMDNERALTIARIVFFDDRSRITPREIDTAFAIIEARLRGDAA